MVNLCQIFLDYKTFQIQSFIVFINMLVDVFKMVEFW